MLKSFVTKRFLPKHIKNILVNNSIIQWSCQISLKLYIYIYIYLYIYIHTCIHTYFNIIDSLVILMIIYLIWRICYLRLLLGRFCYGDTKSILAFWLLVAFSTYWLLILFITKLLYHIIIPLIFKVFNI